MEFIKIPLPDFNFEQVIKSKANEIIYKYINRNNILPYGTNKNIIQDTIKDGLREFVDLRQKLIFINEFIIHVYKLKDEYDKDKVFSQSQAKRVIEHLEHEKNLLKFDDLLLFLYNSLSTLGYNLDKDTFTTDDVEDLERKINAILIKLDEIQVGNEVIFNEFEELKDKLKDDFDSLKSDYPLGKKRWYQRAAGIVVSYSGTKAADEIFEQLKPQLHDFFINQTPHLFNKLIR